MENKVKIKFGQIEFEVEGSEELIERERTAFFSLLPNAVESISSTHLVNDYNMERLPIEGAISVVEEKPNTLNAVYENIAHFLSEKKFKTDTEIVMGIAYYINYIENINPFNAKDIEAKFVEVRLTKPSSVGTIINRYITKAYIAEYNEKKEGIKAYYVTKLGRQWCEEYIGQDNGTKKVSKARRSRSTKESKLIEIPLEELHLERYPEVKKFKEFKKQLLVIMLIYSREKSIEYFSVNDIVSILKNKFQLPATVNQVTGTFKRAGTNFDKKKVDGSISYKMLNGAITEAESIIQEVNNE